MDIIEIDDLNKVFSKNEKPVYVDIETDGLNPFRPDSMIWCIAVCQDPEEVYWHRIRPDLDYRPFFRRHPIIAHRAMFEGMWIAHKFKIIPRIYYDTKVGAYVRDENQLTGLEHVVLYNFPGTDLWGKGQVDFKNPDFSVMKPYNCWDGSHGMKLYQKVDRHFIHRSPKVGRLLKYITMPAQEVFIGAVTRGFHIDMGMAKQNLIQCKQNKTFFNGEISEVAGHRINPGSPKQMCELLYDDLGLKCPVKTKKQEKDGLPARSSSEAALIRLEGKHEVIAPILEWRKWQKYDSTYLTPWITKGPTLHANYGFTDTDTGRLNSTMVKNKRGEKKLGATLHQCPRDPFIRNLVSPRYGDDWCLVACDVSQGELRLVAHAANERNMIDIFNRGEDIHLSTAKTLKKGDIDKETRKKAKAVNFGFVYGMWPPKFVKYCKEKFGLTLTLHEAEVYREGFFDLYPDLEPWYRRVEAQVCQNGFIDSVFGRRRHLPDAMYGSGVQDWVRREMVRYAINSPIQGACSDLLLFIVALIASKSLFWKYKIDPSKAFLVGSAHDSALFECRKDYALELKQIITTTVKELPVFQFFNFEFRVPILVDVNIYDTHWEAEEYTPEVAA